MFRRAAPAPRDPPPRARRSSDGDPVTVHPDDLDRVPADDSNSTEQDGQPTTIDYRVVLPGGETRWMQAKSSRKTGAGADPGRDAAGHHRRQAGRAGPAGERDALPPARRWRVRLRHLHARSQRSCQQLEPGCAARLRGTRPRKSSACISAASSRTRTPPRGKADRALDVAARKGHHEEEGGVVRRDGSRFVAQGPDHGAARRGRNAARLRQSRSRRHRAQAGGGGARPPGAARPPHRAPEPPAAFRPPRPGPRSPAPAARRRVALLFLDLDDSSGRTTASVTTPVTGCSWRSRRAAGAARRAGWTPSPASAATSSSILVDDAAGELDVVAARGAVRVDALALPSRSRAPR